MPDGYVFGLLVDPRDGSQLGAIVIVGPEEYFLLTSLDGGRSWPHERSALPNPYLVAAPDAAGGLYTSPDFQKSADGGRTWRPLGEEIQGGLSFPLRRGRGSAAPRSTPRRTSATGPRSIAADATLTEREVELTVVDHLTGIARTYLLPRGGRRVLADRMSFPVAPFSRSGDGIETADELAAAAIGCADCADPP